MDYQSFKVEIIPRGKQHDDDTLGGIYLTMLLSHLLTGRT